MTICWVTSVWVSVTPPLKNPSHAHVLSSVNFQIVIISSGNIKKLPEITRPTLGFRHLLIGSQALICFFTTTMLLRGLICGSWSERFYYCLFLREWSRPPPQCWTLAHLSSSSRLGHQAIMNIGEVSKISLTGVPSRQGLCCVGLSKRCTVRICDDKSWQRCYAVEHKLSESSSVKKQDLFLILFQCERIKLF